MGRAMKRTFNLANLKFKERRVQDRKEPTGLMPGKMMRIRQDRVISCRPMDVSKEGMGILVAEDLMSDEILTLNLPDGRQVPFRIVWKREDFGKLDLFRYGLECMDPHTNVLEIFQRAGMIRNFDG